jgi:hypothetical protein
LDLYSELREAEEKLEKFVTENAWFMKMYREKYPITFEFTNGQINMFSDSDNERIPEIKFIFKSEVQYVLNTPEDMRIDEKFFSKLLSLSKEVHRLYLLHWFSQKDTRYNHSWKPMWDTTRGDCVGILSKSYRP